MATQKFSLNTHKITVLTGSKFHFAKRFVYKFPKNILYLFSHLAIITTLLIFHFNSSTFPLSNGGTFNIDEASHKSFPCLNLVNRETFSRLTFIFYGNAIIWIARA